MRIGYRMFPARTARFGLLLLFCCWAVGCQDDGSGGHAMSTPTVTVANPVTKQIVEWDAYTGRLEAIDFVEVRARVGGYIKSIHYQEGQIVQEGDLLFVIDPRPFQAELDSAKAALSEAESKLLQAKAQLAEAKAQKEQSDAQLQLADVRVQRARSLKSKNAITQEELDQREAEFAEAKANLKASQARIGSGEAAISAANSAIESAKAGIATAQLNLDYTQIRAEITGRISRQYVTEGNLVSGGTAASTLLTTITSVDPIYCTFDASEQEVLKYVRLANAGKRESSREAKNPVFLGLVDETGFPHQGHMNFVDNRFDPDTATMRARCIFSNEEQVLLPGMFARIRIPGSAAYQAVLIPDSAVGTDQSTQFVYVVLEGAIERRSVELGSLVDGLRVVRQGLTGEESLVIEGLLQVRPEMKVQTKAGSITAVEDGLPDNYEPLPPDKWLTSKPDPLPISKDTSSNSNDETKGETP